MQPQALTAPDLEQYDLLSINVISSTQIANRVAAILAHLKLQNAAEATKTPLVSLKARSRVINKLITIVEIAKRQSNAENVKIYQYNEMGSELVAVKTNSDKAAAGADIDHATDEEPAFQTMPEPDKMHHSPTLSIYLSRVPIDALKRMYG